MFIIKLLLFSISGIFIIFGLMLQTHRILNKSILKNKLIKQAHLKTKHYRKFADKGILYLKKKNRAYFLCYSSKRLKYLDHKKNTIRSSLSTLYPFGRGIKFIGFIILGYLIFHYKTEDLFFGLFSFFFFGILTLVIILLNQEKF